MQTIDPVGTGSSDEFRKFLRNKTWRAKCVLQDVPKRLQFCINSWVLEPMDHLLLRVQWLSMQWPPSGPHLHEHKRFRVSAGTLETAKL